MGTLFSMFRSQVVVPKGFYDYRQDDLALALGIDSAMARAVLVDYHHLLAGKATFAKGIYRGDLHALTNSAIERFACDRKVAANIATWFGRLIALLEERERARQLGVTEKTWVSMCQFAKKVAHSQHIDFEGKTFDAQTGLDTDIGPLFPGALIGCKCSSRSNIEWFEKE